MSISMVSPFHPLDNKDQQQSASQVGQERWPYLVLLRKLPLLSFFLQIRMTCTNVMILTKIAHPMAATHPSRWASQLICPFVRNPDISTSGWSSEGHVEGLTKTIVEVKVLLELSSE